MRVTDLSLPKVSFYQRTARFFVLCQFRLAGMGHPGYFDV